LANHIACKILLILNPRAPKEADVCQRNQKALDSLAIIYRRPVMPDSVMVSGRINGEAQSFYLKHALTVGIRDHSYAHIPSLCSQHLRLHSALYMHPIRKRIPHNVRMTGTSHSQDPDPVNCAGMGESVRHHAPRQPQSSFCIT
jgi:hypothetical protein